MDAITATVEASAKKPLQLVEQVTWGRTRQAKWANNVGAAIMITFSPLWMCLNWITLQYFDGSLTAALREFVSANPMRFARQYSPQPSLSATVGYAAWILWQALLYGYLPGRRCFGQRTPGGHLLDYTANGLMAWTITHLLYLTASFLGLLDPSVIANNWQGLFVAANAYGFALSMTGQLKGYWAPSFLEDRKLSGRLYRRFIVETRAC